VNNFVYIGQPARVVFGAGTLEHLEREIDLLGSQRALVLCTPQQRDQAQVVAERLGARCAGIFDRAVEQARALNADVAVAVGGGSTTGLGKAIALESSLAILAIPTTYAGSEMTPIYGLTEGGLKKTGRDPRVLPKTVIYDVNLTLSLPSALSATSGMNPIAHAVEALYAQDANPIMSMLAQEGIRALATALPGVIAKPHDVEARSQCLYGAWLCGTALGSVGMALHHKLCHTLGGTFNLPHAETHTVVLAHAVAYNRSAAPEAMRAIAAAVGADDAAYGLYALARSLGAPLALKDIGMREADLDRAAELATQSPYYNPRPIEYRALRQLLDDAYFGREPRKS
jgi:alcohol dehydrogenase class IV